jgi:5,10-methylenetetrahydromethanopterin reductase
VRFGVEFVPNVKYYELEYYTKIAEDNEFDVVWITDHYSNRNAYAIMTLLALKTRTIKLGVGVANPYHTHPAVITSAISTVNEISGGRAILGIAAGDKSTLERIGVKWEKPLKRVREAVEIIRVLYAGKPVTYDGDAFKLSGAKLDFKSGNIPIYVGAQGPKMLRLAAEVGDGVLINASHPKDFVEAKKNLMGREFEVVAYTSMSVDKDGDRAREAARIVVAFIVAGCSDVVLERHGLDGEKVEGVRQALNAAFTKGDWASVKKAVNKTTFELSVPLAISLR